MNTDDFQLLYAALTLGALSFLVYLLLTVFGVVAAAKGDLSAEYGRTKTGTPPPNWLGNIGRNLVNQFEFPVLFYVLVAFHGAFVPGASDGLQVILGWVFVASRYLHALIHMTFNSMGLRFLTHRIGIIILAVMWGRFAFAAAAT